MTGKGQVMALGRVRGLKNRELLKAGINAALKNSQSTSGKARGKNDDLVKSLLEGRPGGTTNVIAFGQRPGLPGKVNLGESSGRAGGLPKDHDSRRGARKE
jgi:hypothetical protein